MLASTISEVVKKFLNRTVERDSMHRGVRDELRIEIDRVRNELARVKQERDQTEAELDDWKIKYFELLQQSPRLFQDEGRVGSDQN